MLPIFTRHWKRLSSGRPLRCGALNLVHAQIRGQLVTFCLNEDNDPIQRHHKRGMFYEENELIALTPLVKPGFTFLDVGANIGNHSLFAALILKAGRIIPIEPNVKAYDLLVNNILVNNLLDRADLSMLGVGVSAEQANGYGMQKRQKNIGASKMLAGKGNLTVYRLDELVTEDSPDLIKIDVEGMEIEALAGLEGILKRCRPIISIEVNNDNEAAFTEWTRVQGYATLSVYQRYRVNKNHLIVDAEQLAAYQTIYEPPETPAWHSQASALENLEELVEK